MRGGCTEQLRSAHLQPFVQETFNKAPAYLRPKPATNSSSETSRAVNNNTAKFYCARVILPQTSHWGPERLVPQQ